MKLLTAAKPRRAEDFSFVPEGEILYNTVIVCCRSDSCGCNRALSGTATPRATTIAQVSEVDINSDELFALAADVGEKSRWGGPIVWASFQAIQEAIADREVGETLRPKFDFGSGDWIYEKVPDEQSPSA